MKAQKKAIKKKSTPVKITIKKRKDLLISNLEKSLGIVSTACKASNIERYTFYKWYNTDPEFKKRVDDVNIIQGDFVESKLFELVNQKNPQAVLFYMKYKCRNRGYTDKQEIDVNLSTNDIKFIFGNDTLNEKTNEE